MLNHHRETSSTQTISEVYVDKKIQVKTIDFNTVKNIQTSESDMKEFESYPCHYCDFNIETKHIYKIILYSVLVHIGQVSLKSQNLHQKDKQFLQP